MNMEGIGKGFYEGARQEWYTEKVPRDSFKHKPRVLIIFNFILLSDMNMEGTGEVFHGGDRQAR